ncbi:MAG: ABC transporter permease [Thermoplasmatota archaeon]
MNLKKYMAKRAGWAIVSLLGLSILIFYLARILPGDPVSLMVGPKVPDSAVQEIRHKLALDRPLYMQYFIWLRDVLSGDLGFSTHSQRSLSKDVVEYLPQSLELIVVAGFIQIVGAFLIGVAAGSNINKWQDHLVRVFAYIGVSVPAFVLAVVFQLVFAMNLNLFPTSGALSLGLSKPAGPTGFITIDSIIRGDFGMTLDFLTHTILPATALAIPGMAQVARLIRSGMSDIKEKEYISMARGYGFPERTVRFKYLLRPSIIPAVTVLGMQIAMMLGNAFLVEMVFRWPGFSRFAIEALLRNDLNTIVAVVIIIGLLFAVINLIVDIVTAYIDPRIRYRSS